MRETLKRPVDAGDRVVADREALVSPALRPGRDLLADGRRLARDWRVGRTRFLDEAGVASEADYKRRAASSGRLMQHAHIGFRDVERTVAAIVEVHDTCAKRGVTVDRFGITLDMSMGYPAAGRAGRPKGTGIVLTSPEDFARITDAAPAAAHFGDFMLGLPGALDNTKHALAAGATAIGNLGQYFTFRLPGWDDEIASTEATITALGLIAAQETEVLVHSNLDDGFAGLFADMSSALGMVLVEKYIVEDLIGAPVSHCYGHHFTAPLVRMAFHRALAAVTGTVGTMIFGNTVAYRSTPGGNYASLASYLQADVWALARQHTGHAINPVPVTENERIPDVDEIIDAQIFAARLAEHAVASRELVNTTAVDEAAERLVVGAQVFKANVLHGLAASGIDPTDPAQLMLSLRRIGPQALEALYGAGAPDRSAWSGRRSVMVAEWVAELDRDARSWAARVSPTVAARLRRSGLKVFLACSDVHEHGKALVGRVLAELGVEAIEGGTSADADDLVAAALAQDADLIAVSTYNGVALRYAREVQEALAVHGVCLPVCIGGRLNQVPEDSNSGLPVDVGAEIAAIGVVPCTTPERLIAVLDGMAAKRERDAGSRPATSTVDA